MKRRARAGTATCSSDCRRGRSVSDTRRLRCAIYTRKSTEEGLEQNFNSLQAQREAGEAYIRSQQQSGWVALAKHYDDGGCSGANLERPALQRLLEDMATGKVDAVVVYKVDRLSRSLLDFARLMGVFEQRGVSFVMGPHRLLCGDAMERASYDQVMNGARSELTFTDPPYGVDYEGKTKKKLRL